MFQCIIQQQRNFIHIPNAEFRDVYPGNMFEYILRLASYYNAVYYYYYYLHKQTQNKESLLYRTN